MNDFERRIREALNLHNESSERVNRMGDSLSSLQQVAPLAASVVAATTSAAASKTSPDAFTEKTRLMEDATTAPGAENVNNRNPAAVAAAFATNTPLKRPGLSQTEWTNPYIKAAFPLLLQVEQLKQHLTQYDANCRAQWVREAQHFHQVLIQRGTPLETVNHLTYLLFSWIDETLSRENIIVPVSLLVEFYQDAWGGEKCFEHLNLYWQDPATHREILQFYDLILSLGFYGKYAMMERGPLLLADLRHQLNLLLYLKNPTESLADVVSQPAARPRRRLTPLRLTLAGAVALLAIWGVTSWQLHNQARDLRNAILAWTPPEPKRINIMATLPQPLPEILQEGWLEVRKDPRGWLLIFTSDGAFATGKAILLPDFVKKRNIERLGEALSPWPGDLEVIGHTDSEPFRQNSGESNQRLSLARAETVAERLRHVMSEDSKYQRVIEANGKGDTEPLADNDTEAGRKRNRRVDILWKIGQRVEDANPAAVESVIDAGKN